LLAFIYRDSQRSNDCINALKEANNKLIKTTYEKKDKLLADTNILIGDFYFEESIKDDFLVSILNNLIEYNPEQTNRKNAIISYEKALNYYKKIDNNQLIELKANLSDKLALLYSTLIGNEELAENYYRFSLECWKKQMALNPFAMEYTTNAISDLCNLEIVYRRMNKPEDERNALIEANNYRKLIAPLK
jgi:tetratricopeptide (TPR) repeat protein